MSDTDNTALEAPEGLSKRGATFWAATVAGFDLTPVEAEITAEAARLLDVLDGLRSVVERDGLVMAWGEGTRVNPAVVEARSTRLTLVRLLTALNLPAAEEPAASPEWTERKRARRSA